MKRKKYLKARAFLGQKHRIFGAFGLKYDQNYGLWILNLLYLHKFFKISNLFNNY
jgi:hypothetical protein